MCRHSVTDVVVSGRSGLLQYVEWVARYLAQLRAQGYKHTTLHTYGQSLVRFGDYVVRRGVEEVSQLSECIAPFLAHIGSSGHGPKVWRSMLRRFLLYLQREGIAPIPSMPHADLPNEGFVSQYVRYQRECRGVCLEYSKNVRRCCMAFLAHLHSHGATDLAGITPSVIHGFIVADGHGYSRKTMSGRCYILRGFLTYLYRRGVTARDLAPLVIVPPVFRQEQCPRFLTRVEVQRVLATANRRTRQGRRDYAMLCLMSTYGLRGIEVIRLLLDDIDWRGEKLHIRRRKAGNSTVYPLTPATGNAVLAYLRDGRPKADHRHVFLSLKAPFRPLVYTYALGYLVRRYMAQAGVTVERPGTHTFRYSCAQRLLDGGMPLKTIGDYLGHLRPESTQRYTKIAIEDLREVALGDEEGLL